MFFLKKIFIDLQRLQRSQIFIKTPSPFDFMTPAGSNVFYESILTSPINLEIKFGNRAIF